MAIDESAIKEELQKKEAQQKEVSTKKQKFLKKNKRINLVEKTGKLAKKIVSIHPRGLPSGKIPIKQFAIKEPAKLTDRFSYFNPTLRKVKRHPSIYFK